MSAKLSHGPCGCHGYLVQELFGLFRDYDRADDARIFEALRKNFKKETLFF